MGSTVVGFNCMHALAIARIRFAFCVKCSDVVVIEASSLHIEGFRSYSSAFINTIASFPIWRGAWRLQHKSCMEIKALVEARGCQDLQDWFRGSPTSDGRGNAQGFGL